MFSVRIVIFYTHTFGDRFWVGSTATTTPTLYVAAATHGDAHSMIARSGLIPRIGSEYGVGGRVKEVLVTIEEASHLASVPF